MLERTRVRVYGGPKGQPRARAFARNGMVRMYDPSTAEGWKSMIATAIKQHLPTVPHSKKPMRLDALFIIQRPKSHFRTGKNDTILRDDAPRFYVSKPDRDNLDKAVLDALKQVGFWNDDCLCCVGLIAKVYADPDVRPGAIFMFRDLCNGDADHLIGFFGGAE